MTLGPCKKTLPRFLTQMTFGYQLFQNAWRCIARAQGLAEVSGNVQADIQANDIAQSQGPHGMAVSRDQGMVDVLRTGHTVFQHSHGFE